MVVVKEFYRSWSDETLRLNIDVLTNLSCEYKMLGSGYDKQRECCETLLQDLNGEYKTRPCYGKFRAQKASNKAVLRPRRKKFSKKFQKKS